MQTSFLAYATIEIYITCFKTGIENLKRSNFEQYMKNLVTPLHHCKPPTLNNY